MRGPFDGRMAFVPEGWCDRSLARSARDSATQKSRPVGYGLIRAGVRTDSMIGVTKFRIGKLRQKHGAQVDEKYLWDSLRPIIPYLRDALAEISQQHLASRFSNMERD